MLSVCSSLPTPAILRGAKLPKLRAQPLKFTRTMFEGKRLGLHLSATYLASLKILPIMSDGALPTICFVRILLVAESGIETNGLVITSMVIKGGVCV